MISYLLTLADKTAPLDQAYEENHPLIKGHKILTSKSYNFRWTINMALKTAEKMFYAETPFDAEDLVEV